MFMIFLIYFFVLGYAFQNRQLQLTQIKLFAASMNVDIYLKQLHLQPT